MKIYIVRYKEIGPTVTVIISKGSSRRPSGIATQACIPGHVGKCPIAVVAIEYNAAKTGYEQVRPAVVVIVANNCAHGEAWIADVRLIGNIREGPVMIVMIQGATRFHSMEGHIHAGRIGKINI